MLLKWQDSLRSELFSKMGKNYWDTKFGPVYANEQALSELDSFLGHYKERGSKVFFLVDENTHENCLVRLVPELPSLGEYEVLEVPPGEESKSIEIVYHLWSSLLELEADRHSVLINVGGGMITDLGGFVASTYKRGIDFANVPTSLLAMVDAAIGGKTGIDVGGAKNVAGTFSSSKGLFLIPDFLETLPERETISGFAEMVKHALISGSSWEAISAMSPLELWSRPDEVRASMQVKIDTVESDPLESGPRKYLNFGHTFGHAIESHFLSTQPESPLLHGEAIAIGMWLEVELSVYAAGLDRSIASKIQEFLVNTFPKPELPESSWDDLLLWLSHDKKNKGGIPQFVLLENLGKPTLDHELSSDQLKMALHAWNAK